MLSGHTKCQSYIHVQIFRPVQAVVFAAKGKKCLFLTKKVTV